MAISQQLTELVQTAMDQQASDIYWLPAETSYQIMSQSAGKMTTLATVTTVVGQQLINHIKYRSNMAISDHRRPQLGAMVMTVQGVDLNLRISTVGDFLGRESLVLRLLYQNDKTNLQYLVPTQRQQLVQVLQHSGLVLFSGPMGSGKTTTMYDLVRPFGGQKVVMTIEDPVEIFEPDFLQLQVNPSAQMAYADLLKVGLRHHPEIFIIGEIRDAETAKIAIQAALSGHLVLSTIHARGVYGVSPRLQQLGVDQQTLQQALAAVSYQRLVPLTDGRQATLFDIVTDPTTLMTQPAQLMTSEWRALIEEQQNIGRISPQVAATLG
ncbi:secretion protein E [Lactobacillus sp.] [Lactiplantibacillus mudanjiangensis]|uniref:competence type IV pilus ATPase ComGA n=1 Tax=Lactiplantibacillus mudanjiangensis TaxID=1296538 RepID=UPI00101408B9|nr:competence type IV pilus ATPase ComGA [Lactiplantibacillus mudanjiangensis]VDG33322.1 secretion protein E [Lactobacillus sp.] [Lactiplantibacillus mudanjiangensis]